MSITINIKPELEERLKEIAIQEGKQLDNVIIDLLEGQLLPDPLPDLKKQESELLQRVNLGISAETWERYYRLLEKRDAETLKDEEHKELLALVNQIELANAERMKCLVELARIRQVSLETIMKDLGIGPRQHG